MLSDKQNKIKDNNELLIPGTEERLPVNESGSDNNSYKEVEDDEEISNWVKMSSSNQNEKTFDYIRRNFCKETISFFKVKK